MNIGTILEVPRGVTLPKHPAAKLRTLENMRDRALRLGYRFSKFYWDEIERVKKELE